MNLPRTWAAAGCLAFLSASLASAQTSKDDVAPSVFDVDFFAGGQLFHKRPDPQQTKLLNATIFGMHLTQNFWNYWSFEESMTGSTLADLTLRPFAESQQRQDLEQRVWKLSVNPVFHFTPNGRRLRPFVTAGFSEVFYNATKDGKNRAAVMTPVPAPTFGSTNKHAFNYGGGIKYRFTDLIGLRVDVRGIWSPAPVWGLPNSPVGLPAGVLYIPKGGSMYGMEATAGIGFHFGGRGGKPAPTPPSLPPAKPEPPPPAKPEAARTFQLGPLQCNPSSGYVGDRFTCRTQLTDSANAGNIRYVWTVDGVEQPGVNGPEFSTTNLGPGTHQIRVTATDPATGASASAGPTTITVNPIPPLTITDAADKSELKVGETARLTAQGSQSAYSGALTYTWTTNVGSIRGTGSSVTFDSSNVPFDPANVFKPETRTATITPTVSDQRGRSATGSPLQIRVIKDPQAQRLDDLVYGKGSSRVNNCAKRILIDELQGLMNNNPDVEVLLIGHTDAGEPAALDHQRVYNAAAVLTAGTGVCAKCDLNRIKVSYAGTDQTSDFRSGFCGTSTRQKSDERKADEIAADDAAAKNRRVEIWIIPKGVAMPAGAKDPQPAPVKIIKAKGCPK